MPELTHLDKESVISHALVIAYVLITHIAAEQDACDKLFNEGKLDFALTDPIEKTAVAIAVRGYLAPADQNPAKMMKFFEKNPELAKAILSARLDAIAEFGIAQAKKVLELSMLEAAINHGEKNAQRGRDNLT